MNESTPLNDALEVQSVRIFKRKHSPSQRCGSKARINPEMRSKVEHRGGDGNTQITKRVQK